MKPETTEQVATADELLMAVVAHARAIDAYVAATGTACNVELVQRRIERMAALAAAARDR
jgi:hypothetical protein